MVQQINSRFLNRILMLKAVDKVQPLFNNGLVKNVTFKLSKEKCLNKNSFCTLSGKELSKFC